MGISSSKIAHFNIIFDSEYDSGSSAGNGVQVQVLLRALVLGGFVVLIITL